jgi:hypothetical protein
MLASWQAAQPEVTPVWICTPVGAGVAKAEPGTLAVAEAATRPVGVLPMWQVSQLVPEGMCAAAPAGLVAGMPMILVMPAKALDVPAGTWQETQLLVMPVWLISEPLNLAPSTTGVAAMEEPAPTWQTSHEALVGMWLAGSPTMLKFDAGIAKVDAAAPWHCAQLPLVLGAQAWMLVSVGGSL